MGVVALMLMIELSPLHRLAAIIESYDKRVCQEKFKKVCVNSFKIDSTEMKPWVSQIMSE